MKLFRRYHAPPQADLLRLCIVTTALMLASCFAVAGSNYESEFIPFPEVTIHYYDRDVPPTQQHGSAPLVDFFYTAKYNNWRVLSEFLVRSD
jgi:hypothetical protein